MWDGRIMLVLCDSRETVSAFVRRPFTSRVYLALPVNRIGLRDPHITALTNSYVRFSNEKKVWFSHSHFGLLGCQRFFVRSGASSRTFGG